MSEYFPPDNVVAKLNRSGLLSQPMLQNATTTGFLGVSTGEWILVIVEAFVVLGIFFGVILEISARRKADKKDEALFFSDFLNKWNYYLLIGKCAWGDEQGIVYRPASNPAGYDFYSSERRNEFEKKFAGFWLAWNRLKVASTKHNRDIEKLYHEIDDRVKMNVEDPWIEEMKKAGTPFLDSANDPKAERFYLPKRLHYAVFSKGMNRLKPNSPPSELKIENDGLWDSARRLIAKSPNPAELTSLKSKMDNALGDLEMWTSFQCIGILGEESVSQIEAEMFETERAKAIAQISGEALLRERLPSSQSSWT